MDAARVGRLGHTGCRDQTDVDRVSDRVANGFGFAGFVPVVPKGATAREFGTVLPVSEGGETSLPAVIGPHERRAFIKPR